MSLPTGRSSSQTGIGATFPPPRGRGWVGQQRAASAPSQLPAPHGAPILGAPAVARSRPALQVCRLQSAAASAQPAADQDVPQDPDPGPDAGVQRQLAQVTRRKWRELPDTARVALFTGAYITVAGVAALLFPTQLFGLLFPASTLSAGWVRVGGTLAILFGAYYLGAGLDDFEGRKPLRMYQATVLGRALLAVIFAVLVGGGQCGRGLLLLAAANAVGAWRMVTALRRDGVAWGWRWALPGWAGALAGWLAQHLALLCMVMLSIV